MPGLIHRIAKDDAAAEDRVLPKASPAFRPFLCKVCCEEPSAMPSRVEHIDILRSVSLFVETPAETLAEVAALLDDITAHAGETIIEKGAPGDCLYILVAGGGRAPCGGPGLPHPGAGRVFLGGG